LNFGVRSRRTFVTGLRCDVGASVASCKSHKEEREESRPHLSRPAWDGVHKKRWGSLRESARTLAQDDLEADRAISALGHQVRPLGHQYCVSASNRRSMVAPAAAQVDEKGAEGDPIATGGASTDRKRWLTELLDQQADRGCGVDRKALTFRPVAKLSRSDLERGVVVVRDRCMRERRQLARLAGLLSMRAPVRSGVGTSVRKAMPVNPKRREHKCP
jgi:hypothetical protein